MIAIALAFALQAAAPEPSQAQVFAAATRAWDECLDDAARRGLGNEESGDSVASGALNACQTEDRAALAAGVELALAKSPTISREDALERAVAQRRSRLRMRQWDIRQSADAARRRLAPTRGERLQ